MKHILVISVFLVLLFSCEKDLNTCDSENPLEEIAWLSDLKASITNCTCEVSIFQAKYNKGTVFYVAITDPVCNSIFNADLRDCSGNIVKNYPNADETFEREVTERKVIYRCKTLNK
jgi:hypothetical protein